MPARRSRVLAFLSFLLLSATAFPVDFRTDSPPEVLANALLADMKDEEILAQTFMLGWVGADPSPLILEWIAKRRIGGVKIFGWNTDDTQRLAAAVGGLQKAAVDSRFKIPLFVATDQEGGWIRHVKGATSETPGNMALGASGYPADAVKAGYYIGREIATLGVNMNFAPTVDLYTNRNSVLIGPRAFGDDPVKVAVLGASFAKGLERAGVIATAKHFPGHGDTELDSHGVLPRILADENKLWERELVPYRMLAKERIPAVMSGHLAFPLTKGGEDPASLSRWFLTDLLRGRVGFKGLIITDDLLMNGATAGEGSLSRAAKRALEAGNDVLMFSKTPAMDDPVWTNLLWAYRNEKAFRDRVKDAARRVLALKLDYLRRPGTPPLSPDPEEVAKRVPDPEGRAFFAELASRSVTILGGADLPLKEEAATHMLIAGQFDDFLRIGKLAYPDAETFRFSYIPFDRAVWAEREAFLKAAGAADRIVLCVANPASLEMLLALKNSGKKVYVVSALTPVYLDRAPWVDAALAVYSYAPESFIAGFSALSGRIPADGVLPYSDGR